MVFALVALLLVCLWKIKFSGHFPQYAGLDQATAVKGFFAVIIFLSHFCSYLPAEATQVPSTHMLLRVLTYLDQSMVAMFFFYSGFGISVSLLTKPGYSESFFKKRFLKVLFDMDFAVLFFVLLNLTLGLSFPIKNYILCWIGWKSIGNSNWFVFVILMLYLASWVCMKIKKGKLGFIIMPFILLLWLFLFYWRRSSPWWYNTIIVFPLGIIYAEYKKHIDSFLQKWFVWIVSILLLILTYIGLHYFFGGGITGIISCLFCLIIMLGTMKVQMVNPVLLRLGKNAFAIYMLQRIPMILFSHFGLQENVPLFFIVSVIMTALLAEGFSYTVQFLHKKLF